MTNTRCNTLTVIGLLGALLSACGGDASPQGSAPLSGASATTKLSQIWSDVPLAPARDVIDVREHAHDGDAVVLRGTLQDFGEYATFRLVEDSLKDCTEMGDGDQCKEPWDYCCTDPTLLGQLTVNVEFLDGDLPIDESLRGQHGLDHLSEVTVAGILRVDPAGNLRLEATRLGLQ